MRVNGGSELARMQMLQKQAIATRNRLDVAAQEMTTNLKASRFEATGGNLTRLFALERSLDRNAVFSQTISLTELRLEIMQESLGQILTPAEDLAIDLIAGRRASATTATALLHATTARRAFADTVGLLNTQVAGQSLFAGTATDSAGAGAGRRDPRRSRRAGRRRGDGGRRDRRDRRLLRQAGRRLLHRAATSASPDDLTPVDIGEGQRLDYGMRADERRARRGAARPGDGGGGRRRRLRRQRRPSRWRCSARPARGCSRPRRACSTCAPTVGSLQEAVERAKAQRVVRARHAGPRADQDRRDRPARGGLGLPDARGAARVDLHRDLAAREPALRQLHALTDDAPPPRARPAAAGALVRRALHARRSPRRRGSRTSSRSTACAATTCSATAWWSASTTPATACATRPSPRTRSSTCSSGSGSTSPASRSGRATSRRCWSPRRCRRSRAPAARST